MKGLIVIAHGSRREASNVEIAQLAGRVADSLSQPPQFDHVAHSFLELAAPDIPQAIDDAIAAGCTNLVLVPYFLSSGQHVAKDIPAIIDTARQRHPTVLIQLVAHVGDAAIMPQLVLQQASLAETASDV